MPGWGWSRPQHSRAPHLWEAAGRGSRAATPVKVQNQLLNVKKGKDLFSEWPPVTAPWQGRVWGICLPGSSPHPPRALHQPGAAAAPRDAALAPGTSKAAQAAREPADLRPPQAVLLSVGLRTAGRTDKSPSYSPSTSQPRRTAAAPTEHGRARGSTLAQEATPRLPRTSVNQSGEERMDIHHDRSWHAGWLWTGPASAAQTDCCSGVLHTGSCCTRPAGSKSFLHQHRQEPLTWSQPGFHPELIRSCS